MTDVAPAQAPAIEIEAALVAPGLGLAQTEFRQLMEQRRIIVLCERGTGDDAGRYRASFYYGERRVRLVVDRRGRVVDGGADPQRASDPAARGRPAEPTAHASPADPVGPAAGGESAGAAAEGSPHPHLL